MAFSKTSLLQSLALFCVISTGSLSVAAQQPDPISPMNQQLAKLAGSMQAVAEVCGDYSAEQLDEIKQQQKKQLVQSGMSEADFDEAFGTSLSEVQAKWKTVSKHEQKEICDNMKQQLLNAFKLKE
jgi:predicted secreted protein